MATPIHAKVLEQLLSLKDVDLRIPKIVASKLIAKRASQLAPRDTGFMADHITGDEDGVHSEAHYTVYVEFGTFKMAAQPFLRPAVSEVQRNAVKAFGTALVIEIKKKLRIR